MKIQSHTTNVWAVLAALAIAILGCDRAPVTPATPAATQSAKSAGPEWFADVTTKLGIDFVHQSGAHGQCFFPELVGSGCALFDYDNDGRLDIYLIQNGGTNAPARNQLYHQEADGHFKNVSAGSGLDIAGRGMGVAIGDANNDGFPDVIVGEYGAVHFFLNNGGKGTFTEITQQAGIDNPLWASSAAFFDYDRDGWLDLVIANYVELREHNVSVIGGDGNLDYPGPQNFHGQITKLYRNRGRGLPQPGNETKAGPVGFDDVTDSSGLIREPGPGLGVVGADFDGDGWLDILIADDGQPNRLFINQRNGTFKNEALVRGLSCNALGESQANMGIAIGDVDGDGLLDVYVTHLVQESNILWKQGPAGLFRDCTAATGLAVAQRRGTGFGDAFADFNNDGYLDLAVVNGAVKLPTSNKLPQPDPFDLERFWSRYAEHNDLVANDGTGKFHNIADTNPTFCGKPNIGRGLAVGDIDADGGLDMVTVNVYGPAKVYRNVVPNRGHWAIVRAIEPAMGGRDAYGAKITVVAGNRRRVGWINPGYSFQSSCDPRAHFGLGTTSGIDAIEVEWPNGSRERFPSQTTDKLIVLRHGEGQTIAHETDR